MGKTELTWKPGLGEIDRGQPFHLGASEPSFFKVTVVAGLSKGYLVYVDRMLLGAAPQDCVLDQWRWLRLITATPLATPTSKDVRQKPESGWRSRRETSVKIQCVRWSL